MAVADFPWQLPTGFQPPLIPEDNPITPGKVRLGRALFFDRRLSADNSLACSDCHQPVLAFSDGKALPAGISGERLASNSMSLVNVAYRQKLGWRGESETLESQMRRPLFGEHPREMGVRGNETEILARFRHLEAEFAAEFGNGLNMDNVIRAIASFERTLIAADSSFDRWLRLDERPDETVVQGYAVFLSLGCAGCHSGPQLTTQQSVTISGTTLIVPTLRNIALTAPYLHDGSLPSLDAVLSYYQAGPAPASGLRAFTLSSLQSTQLLAFLASLSEPVERLGALANGVDK